MRLGLQLRGVWGVGVWDVGVWVWGVGCGCETSDLWCRTWGEKLEA